VHWVIFNSNGTGKLYDNYYDEYVLQNFTWYAEDTLLCINRGLGVECRYYFVSDNLFNWQLNYSHEYEKTNEMFPK
jgi:hypothetical protein